MRKLYALAAVGGIIFLYGISLFSHPVKVELNAIWEHEGEEIIAEGMVENRMGNVLEISDGKARACVYFEDNDDIHYGDVIRVRGTVGDYSNSLAIYATDVAVIKRWDRDCISVSYLAENYDAYAGLNVNVTGYVYSLSRDYFYLTDEYSEYRMKVYANDTSSLQLYENIYVKALFSYNPKNACFSLNICEPFHGVFLHD